MLPYPKFPLNLEEKQNVIKILASKGATIEEINTIRKRLSILKGGGLAKLAKPAKVSKKFLSLFFMGNESNLNTLVII